MMDPIKAFRDLFARLSPAPQGTEVGHPARGERSDAAEEGIPGVARHEEPPGKQHGAEREPGLGERPPGEKESELSAGLAGEEAAPRQPARGEIRDFPLRPRADREAGGHPTEEQRAEGQAASRVARRVRAYLDARAEEALASLLEELSVETAKESGEAMERVRESISHEIGQVQEGVASSQRELSRIGRELVRSGASLESMRDAVSALAPALERLERSFQAQALQEITRERQLREEAERAALEDMLATLDGLEAGMEHGKELVQTLSEAQRRIEDATVQRWWRAMGEATGVKRPLPDVPAGDLQGWLRGLELTHRRLQDGLARRGVTPIEALGRPFDPYLHEAVAVEPCPPEQDGLVLRAERRGYRISDRVLRLAQVVVGRAEPPRSARPRRRGRAAEAEPDVDRAPGQIEQREEEAGGGIQP